MAEKRMFARSVILNDAFLEMSSNAQLLYFFLGLSADDDGFVGSPKMILRQTGGTTDALRELVNSGFVIPFKSGVIVITHWRVNNTIKTDRYTPTLHTAEKEQITTLDNKVYILQSERNPSGTNLEPKAGTNPDPKKNNKINENMLVQNRFLANKEKSMFDPVSDFAEIDPSDIPF